VEKQKDTITLRLSAEVNAHTKKKAEHVGISQNAFLNVLIDLGLRVYESETGFIAQPPPK
jgi:predicted DNA binding CopG/RHH family protein